MNKPRAKQLLSGLGLLCLGVLVHADTFTYDNLNRLTSVTYSSGGSRTYSYDAAGNRLTMVNTAPAGAAIALSAGALNFASQNVGSSSATQTVTVSNAGTAALNIASVVASGDYVRSTTCGNSLAPSASCSITVTFTPLAAGARSGVVTITNDAAGSPHSISLSGAGATAIVAPICSVTASPTSVYTGGSSTLLASCPGAASYSWTGGTCAGLTGTSCTVTPGSTTSYTVVGSNAGGTGSASVTVSVSACTYALSASSASVGAGAGSGSLINVTSPCAWTAASNVSWLAVTSGASSTGNGNVGYSVAANPSTAARTGILTIGGQTFSVMQAGAAIPAPVCALSANPSSIYVGGSSVLTASCPNATSYLWSGGTCAGTTGSTCDVTPTSTTTYSVIGTNPGGSSSALATVTVMPQIPANERAALLDLYNATKGTSWTKNTGWLGSAGTECTWFGISCDSSQRYVTGVSLGQNNLNGTLPDLSRLGNLQSLQLNQNQLSGEMPSLAGLASLKVVNAEANRLSGAIPALGSLTSLEEFRVGNNQLSGTIPQLNGLSKLRRFEVQNNQLTGSIPPFGGLVALSVFNAMNNQLTGPVPSAPSTLSAAQSSLCGNSLASSGNAGIDAAWVIATGVNWVSCQTAAPVCSLTASPAAMYAGMTSKLTADCSGATSHSWTGGTCAGTTSSTCTVSPNSTTAYTVTGTNSGGSGSASATVTVSAATVGVLTAPPPGSTLTGSTVTFGWNPGDGVSNYMLRVGSSSGGMDLYSQSQGNNVGVTITGLPIDGRKIYVTLLSQTGAGWQSSTYIYTANSDGLIRPSCTLTASPASIAAGASSTLNASCSPAASSYFWTGGTCAGQSGSSCIVSPSATTMYTVAGVNPAGTGTAASTSVTVTKDTTPVCTLTALPSSVIAGASSTLTATCSPAATSYVWTGTPCSTKTGPTCSINPFATSTYSVAGVTSLGVGPAASVTVVVPASGTPVCTLSATPAVVSAGGTSTLTAKCTPAATSYTWSGAGFGPMTAIGTVTPTAPTVYSVTGSNSLGSGNAATTAVYVCNTPPSQNYPGLVFAGNGTNEQLTSGIGGDTIDGGPGFDTVIYQCNRNAFTIAKTASGWTVSSVAEGIDTLTNVERIKFGNETLALDISGNAGQAYRIYQAAFNRVPDNGGLKFWIQQMDNGMSLRDVAAGFVYSAEFRALYGDNPTNAEFLTKLYSNVLHRIPDQGGYDWWLGQLNAGTYDKITTLMSFSESPENQAGVLNAIINGIDLLN
jgi:YD repeat-containing protein